MNDEDLGKFGVVDVVCEGCPADSGLHVIVHDLGDGGEWEKRMFLCTACLVKFRDCINMQLESRAFMGEVLPT